MEHVWQWLWDRLSPRGLYVAVAMALGGGQLTLIYLSLGLVIVAREDAHRYGTVTLITIAVSTLFTGIGAALLKSLLRPRSSGPPATTWTPYVALEGTYKYVHRIDGAGLYLESVAGMVYAAVAGAICGASKADIAVYAVIGLTSSIAVHILGTRSLTEAAGTTHADSSTGRRHRLGRRTALRHSQLCPTVKPALLAATFYFALAGAFVASATDESLVLR